MSEYLHVEQPFLTSLAPLGWTVIDQGQGIPSDPTASLRNSFRQIHLPDVFRDAVRDLNRTPDGTPWLTDPQLDDLRDQLLRQSGGLLEANENVHQLFLKAQVDRNHLTDEPDPVVQLIDFQHPERNRFHAINQFRVDTPGCVKHCIIPDIVLFVNGLPLVVVEAKIGSANTANPLHAAFEQLQRYRNDRPDTLKAGLREGEPRLFYPNLLLIRTCGERAEFGTISGGYEHFYEWRTAAQDLPDTLRRSQEMLIHGLLTPATLLEILRTCTVYMDTDAGRRIKVVCRYQQHRAARKIVQRLRDGASPTQRSGVVWHTQGSGKSLTMVFVARMLRAAPDLADYKIILVNDRVDLEEQLSRTARLIGGRVNIIHSTAHLREHLASAASDINMVMIHKFSERPDSVPAGIADALGRYHVPPSGQGFGVVNPGERILLMIDEAHRTQGSDLGDNLFEAFPNATRIAFTGTPLLSEHHGGKRTVHRFGDYIDQYKLMDAVRDGATLQILYEGRTADTAIRDKHQLDQQFEDLFRDRSDEEIAAIRKKYGATGDILEAEQRIHAIARDLVDHYLDNVFPEGFKAQVVCHSKLAAVRYRHAIREALARRSQAETDPERARRLQRLRPVVVISPDPTNEPALFTEARREAQRWQAVENFCKPFAWDDDAELTGIAFLIVCDMLLTGFDAPIEQVMYLDKRLREHTLLQAIARVNRVARHKHRGFIVDYIGLANNLADALSLYADEDLADLQAGLKNRQSELPILEERYQRLLQHFRGAGIAEIEALVRESLPDRAREPALIHAAVDSLEDIRRRADFDVFLKKFLQSLNLVLPDPAGHRYRGPARRFGYLQRMARERYKDDSLDLADAGAKVRNLINEHLVELGIDPRIPPMELLADDFVERLEQHAGGNDRARASEMEHAIRKHCTIHLDEDPAFYGRLSEKLEQLIQQYHEHWDQLVEHYRHLRDEALAGRTGGVDGLDPETSTFHDHVARLAFDGEVPGEVAEPLKRLLTDIVRLLQETIGVLDFWQKPTQVRELRGRIEQTILLTGIPALVGQYQRLAVEIVKLAEKRHQSLIR